MSSSDKHSVYTTPLSYSLGEPPWDKVIVPLMVSVGGFKAANLAIEEHGPLANIGIKQLTQGKHHACAMTLCKRQQGFAC